jgi:hypothetical protein
MRQVAALAGAGVVTATAAVALPTLAQSDENPSPSVESPITQPVADVKAETNETSSPESDALRLLQSATPEERLAFVQMFWTPEQRAAFALYIATPEQREAFVKMFQAPPPPPPQPSAPRVSAPARPAATTNRGGGANNGSFLNCVRNRESRGQYSAVNGSSGAAGAYQFMPGTARATAMHAGRPDLANRPVTSWSPADQDAMAAHLYSWQGAAPWGGGC